MPELAEVEYFRRQWNAGFGNRVIKIALHARKRVFRGTDTRALREDFLGLAGAPVRSLERHGDELWFYLRALLWTPRTLRRFDRSDLCRPCQPEPACARRGSTRRTTFHHHHGREFSRIH